MMLAAGGITFVDWVVVALYFVGLIGMGAWFAYRQRTTDEYFLGSRSMPSWVVGLSIIATLLSTISYLAMPGEMIKHGPGVLLNLFSIPMAYFLIAYIFIPFFMRLPITSAYEYLDSRFGNATRALGAIYFIVIRIVWMSVVVYTASGAMARMTGTKLEYVVLAVGIFTTFYAALGGIRAVIWTDVIQFIILMGGAVFAVCFVSWHMGLTSWISVAIQESRLESPIFSWDPRVRITVVSITLHYFAWRICTYSADQTVVQRYLTTRDAPAAKRSFLIAMISTFSLAVVLSMVGFALLAYYQHHPEFLTGEMSGKLRENADDVFPFFIAHQLPVGLTGLITAALFAAAMSSLDSGVNSVSAVVTVDFYNRYRGREASDSRSLNFAKVLGLCLGLSATVLALFVGNIEGNIVEVTNKSTSCIVGPLFAMFAMGMFTRRSNQAGAIGGALIGFATGLVVTFSGQWFGETYDISFTHIITSSILVSWVSGYSISLFVGREPTEEQLSFRWRSVMSRPDPRAVAGNR